MEDGEPGTCLNSLAIAQAGVQRGLGVMAVKMEQRG